MSARGAAGGARLVAAQWSRRGGRGGMMGFMRRHRRDALVALAVALGARAALVLIHSTD